MCVHFPFYKGYKVLCAFCIGVSSHLSSILAFLSCLFICLFDLLSCSPSSPGAPTSLVIRNIKIHGYIFSLQHILCFLFMAQRFSPHNFQLEIMFLKSSLTSPCTNQTYHKFISIKKDFKYQDI